MTLLRIAWLWGLTVLMASPAAFCQKSPCGEHGPNCEGSEQCVFSIADRRSCMDSFPERYTCVPSADLARFQVLKVEGFGVPVLFLRPQTFMSEGSDKRRELPGRPVRIEGDCNYDEQCGFHGFCGCVGHGLSRRGVCTYNEASYAERIALTKRAAEAGWSLVRRALDRLLLRNLEARDSRLK